MASEDNAELRRNLDPFYLGRNDPWATYSRAISMYSYLPCLRAFYPCLDISTNSLDDQSGHGRNMTTSGDPDIDIDNFTPYMQLVASNTDYASVADNQDHDITGTESRISTNINGLTIGAWIYFDTVAATQRIFSKWSPTGNQRSYSIMYNSAGPSLDAQVSVDGTAITTVASAVGPNTDEWIFLAGKFVPSTSLTVYYPVGGILSSVENTTSIPASIYNSASSLTIGRNGNGTNYFDGRVALCFLCACALPDDMIFGIYQHTKVLFRA